MENVRAKSTYIKPVIHKRHYGICFNRSDIDDRINISLLPCPFLTWVDARHSCCL